MALIGVIAPATAAPAHDSFGSAKVLSGDELNETFPIGDGTTQAGEPLTCFSTTLGSTVWYRIDAAADARIAVSTTGSEVDHGVIIYQGTSLGNLSLRSCGSWRGSGDAEFRITASTVAGLRYYVQIGTIGGDSGPLVLNVVSAKPPANEDIAAATPVTAEPYVRTVDMRTARDSGFGSRCLDFFDFESSVWYRYTPPTSRTLLLDTTGTAFPHGSAIYTSDGADLDCRSTAGEISADVVAGQTYYIGVFGTNGRSGIADIRIEAPPAPPHDTIENAKTIPAALTGPYNDLVRTLGAAPGADPDGCGAISGRTVWYRWTPSSPVRFLAAVGDNVPRLDWTLAVIAEANGTRRTVWCGTRAMGQVNPRLAEFQAVAVPGVTYYFQLGGLLADGGTAGFAVVPV